MKILIIICWIRTIYYNAFDLGFYQTGIPTSGHNFVEQKDGILKCKICGLISK